MSHRVTYKLSSQEWAALLKFTDDLAGNGVDVTAPPGVSGLPIRDPSTVAKKALFWAMRQAYTSATTAPEKEISNGSATTTTDTSP